MSDQRTPSPGAAVPTASTDAAPGKTTNGISPEKAYLLSVEQYIDGGPIVLPPPESIASEQRRQGRR